MITAAALTAYALLVGLGGPRLLALLAVLERTPALKLALWQSASVSLIISVVLAGIALALPSLTISGGLAELLSECVIALRAQYATPGGALTGSIGGLLAASVVLRGGGTLVASARSTRRSRAAHRDGLAILGRTRQDLSVTVVEHAAAAVYCVPGRHRQVVVTSGALAALDGQELTAVLAHERAHLSARHDLAVGFAAALDRAFPRVPLFARGAPEAARLVELLADDAASRSTDRQTVATALVALAAGSAPSMTLGAGGPSTVVRVERMLAPARPLGRVATAGIATAALLVLCAPAVIAAGPALAARGLHLCPVGQFRATAPVQILP